MHSHDPLCNATISNQLNDVNVPGVLANCVVFELDTAGNVFLRFFPSRVGTEFDNYQNSSEFYFTMFLLHASKGEFCNVNS